jgi:hypothetical protein
MARISQRNGESTNGDAADSGARFTRVTWSATASAEGPAESTRPTSLAVSAGLPDAAPAAERSLVTAGAGLGEKTWKFWLGVAAAAPPPPDV